MTERTIEILDTTLRDGAQSEQLSFSVKDKINIIHALDRAGIAVIEAGNPGASPKDMELFAAMRGETLKHAQLAAFTPTRRKTSTAEEDPMLAAVVACGAPIACVFGKSSRDHTEKVLAVSETENLAMIDDSIRYLRANGLRVYFDAEHYFDGYRADPAFALATVRTAFAAGAEQIVLCDTNGGTLPAEVARIVGETIAATIRSMPIHPSKLPTRTIRRNTRSASPTPSSRALPPTVLPTSASLRSTYPRSAARPTCTSRLAAPDTTCTRPTA